MSAAASNSAAGRLAVVDPGASGPGKVERGAQRDVAGSLHSPEAEQSVLGAALQDNAVMPGLLAAGVGERHFVDAGHRSAWNAMHELHVAGRSFDTVTVFQHLRDLGREEEAGGLTYLTALEACVPSARNALAYASILREKLTLRTAAEIAERLRLDIQAPGALSATIIGRASAALHALQVSAAPLELPKPLPPELLPVDAFPLAALPDAFRPWATDVAARMGAPVDFVAVPLLVAAASLVARLVGIRPQRHTDWLERGNLWALIVGRPGIMKSPAMAQALAPMDRLEARAAAIYNEQTAQHQAGAQYVKLRAEAGMNAARSALKKDARADVSALLKADDESDAPTRRRYVINDLTYEKLGLILAENPDGVLSVRDEMRGLLLSLAREESAPARAFYLQAWSGGCYTFDRIGRGTVTVEDARLSVIGGLQPGPLAELVQQARRGSADDGMIERFLIAWPDAPGEWREVDRWPDSQAKRLAWEAFEHLDALTADALGAERETDLHGAPRGLPFLRFDDDAAEVFGEWRRELEQSIRQADGEGLEGALPKFRHHIPALALALHVIDGGCGPVNLAATLRALALAEYFESHARRLHGSGKRTTVRAARTIIEKARANALPDPFAARDVYRNAWAGLSDRATAVDALDMLTAHGWLTETTLETGGRPASVYSLTAGARRG